MEEAKQQIELAIADSAESLDMYTWYVRGFIYKEEYKLAQTSDTQSASREIAVASFLKSKEIANNDDEITLNHNTALKYLASTYYNDALRAASSFEIADEKKCEALMARFYSLMSGISPAKDFLTEYNEFYTAKAQRFVSLWSFNNENNDLFNSGVENYLLVMTLNPKECNTYYNLGVLYYNKVVYEFGKNPSNLEQLSYWIGKSNEYFDEATILCPTQEMLQAIQPAKELFNSLLQNEMKGQKN